jgi:hypothetical protein
VTQLKCDETAPSCLQCKKRNVPCPGYEKTLKWSTKYEVFSPVQFKSPSSKPRPTTEVTSEVADANTPSLPTNVANGIEALAAVLPAGRKTTVSGTITKQASPSAPSPPALEEPVSAQESSTEDEDSPRDFEPFTMEDIDAMHPIMLDGLVDAIPLPQDDFSFDPFEDFDLDSGSFDESMLDLEDVSHKQDLSSSSATSMLTTRESSREVALDCRVPYF